MTGNPDNQ